MPKIKLSTGQIDNKIISDVSAALRNSSNTVELQVGKRGVNKTIKLVKQRLPKLKNFELSGTITRGNLTLSGLCPAQ